MMTLATQHDVVDQVALGAYARVHAVMTRLYRAMEAGQWDAVVALRAHEADGSSGLQALAAAVALVGSHPRLSGSEAGIVVREDSARVVDNLRVSGNDQHDLAVRLTATLTLVRGRWLIGDVLTSCSQAELWDEMPAPIALDRW